MRMLSSMFLLVRCDETMLFFLNHDAVLLNARSLDACDDDVCIIERDCFLTSTDPRMSNYLSKSERYERGKRWRKRELLATYLSLLTYP